MISDSTNRMDGTKEASLTKLSPEHSDALTIRCVNQKTEAFVSTGAVSMEKVVRLKFDDRKPIREAWHESASGNALFSPDPIFLRDNYRNHDNSYLNTRTARVDHKL